MRAVAEDDLPGVTALLRAVFVAPDAMAWTEGLVRAMWTWRWARTGLSLRTPQGVIFVDARKAGVLRLGHIGPVAVTPQKQGEGHGLALLEAVECAARTLKLDALTLTTHNPALYRRAGFEVLERYRPRVASLVPNVPPGLGWLLRVRPRHSHNVRQLGPWEASLLGCSAPRPGAIHEDPLSPPPPAIPTSAFQCRGATVSAAILPAVAGPFLQVRGAIGGGTALLAAVDAALLWGLAQGCQTAMSLPGAGNIPRLRWAVGTQSFRMLKPLRELQLAGRYDEQSPAM